jgi:hypothetical protein
MPEGGPIPPHKMAAKEMTNGEILAQIAALVAELQEREAEVEKDD